MSETQVQNLKAAKSAESTVVLIELDAAQLEAMNELGITESRDDIASAAFAAALRGKVQSAADKAIKAKYIAQSKNKVALAEECEKDIQMFIKLKQRLG